LERSEHAFRPEDPKHSGGIAGNYAMTRLAFGDAEYAAKRKLTRREVNPPKRGPRKMVE
jgi:hypothetical protein